MKKSLLFCIIALFLAACSSAEERFDEIRKQPNFTSYERVVKQEARANFKCQGFDSRSETCAMITEFTAWDGQNAEKIAILGKRDPNLHVTAVFLRHDVESPDGFNCYTKSVVDLDAFVDLPENHPEAARIKDRLAQRRGAFEEILTISNVVCEAYFRDGHGYVVKMFTPQGEENEGWPDRTVLLTSRRYDLRVYNES
ncbi:MAG: hypothetical protein AAGE61_07585 [Pseudomonadota bacterium]